MANECSQPMQRIDKAKVNGKSTSVLNSVKKIVFHGERPASGIHGDFSILVRPFLFRDLIKFEYKGDPRMQTSLARSVDACSQKLHSDRQLIDTQINSESFYLSVFKSK